MDREKDSELLETYAGVFKALGHPVRLCIARGLWEEEDKNVGDIKECLDLPQSTVSQHLNTLKAAGVVTGERQGTEVYYHLADEKVAKILELLFKEV